MLVRGGDRAAAAAGGNRRLSLPGVHAPGGGGTGNGIMTARWRIDAVLLDMDGTLVDSERVNIAALEAALAAHGFADGRVVAQGMIGLATPECEQMLRDRYGDNVPLAAINDAFVVERDAMMHEGLPAKPGALALLDALREAECPMAVVTASSRHSAEHHLTAAGIRPRFDVVVTRDDVAQTKPHPELYLLGARRLGVDPRHCIAVEDSAVGIAAAHAAGATVLMVPDILPPTELSRAQCAAVLPDLYAVLTMLRERGGLGLVPSE
jgi:HAD superfamily hydrolase (TIGR01509 family)